MAGSGTTSGPEILLALAPCAGAPRHAQLETALRDAVRTGHLAPGQRLPASRVLATDLGVSRRLVVEAYQQLIAEGYLIARPGSGTRVCDRAEPIAAPPKPSRAAERPSPPRWDLRPGVPALAHFPRVPWRRAWQTALTHAADAELGYPDPAGSPRLRTVLAAYLGRVRGVAAFPDSTLIVAGFTQGLDLLARTLAAAGARTIALEDPGLPHRAPILTRAGMTALPVPVDADGILVDQLPDHGVQAVLTTPAHQFPTGAILAPHRREALLAWAARTGALVVEDDYDGEFRFDRRAVGALQGRAPDRVVYLGSTSKTLAPALRLGWLVSPPSLTSQLITAKWLTDHGSPILDQLALAEMINTGAYDRHIRASRARYKTNREALAAAIRRHQVPLRLSGISAGVQTLATILNDLDADTLTKRAATAGIAFDSLTRYQHTRPPAARSLVLGYGATTPHGIDQAMTTLTTLMNN